MIDELFFALCWVGVGSYKRNLYYSTHAVLKHRENLLRAENNRISRIYRLEQIEQIEKTLFMIWFQWNTKKRLRLPINWKHDWLKILVYTAILLEKSKKNQLKNLQSQWIDNFWSESIFCFEKNKFNNFRRKFPESRKKQFAYNAAIKIRFESSRLSGCLVMPGKIVRLYVACKKLAILYFILRLPNFESNLQNPAKFYRILIRNLKDITAADESLAWKVWYESSKIIQKVFDNIYDLTKVPCTFN